MHDTPDVERAHDAQRRAEPLVSGAQAASGPKVVHIEVHGQRYPIKTVLDPAYVQELARYVHQKMSLAAEVSPSSDMLALAVLAALNVADELFRLRDEQSVEAGSVNKRALELERILDQALQLAGEDGVAAPPPELT